jgi:putative Ca2+/H+ antiporter (TMEM165/GDT1 family)
MGDRTQILTLMLAARFRAPWPILAGMILATLANHLAAGALGVWFGRYLTPDLLNLVVGVSLLGMALWTLVPDKADEGPSTGRRGAFLATLIAFFLAEIGDKTEVATLALAAAYSNLALVVAGTTLGLLAANVPVVFLGSAFAARLPLRFIRYGASALFAVLGVLFLAAAFSHGNGLF